MHSLSKRVTFLQEINATMATVLPETARNHVAIAGYADGELVIITDSGTWATRLRYQLEDIRRALAQKMRLNLDRLDIRVQPPLQISQPAPRRHRQIPASARRQLAESSKYISDRELAAAMNRLSRAGQQVANQAAATGRALT